MSVETTSVDKVELLGVFVANMTQDEAVGAFESFVDKRDGRCRAVYIVNAHTLNLAAADPGYRVLLNMSALTLGDGTGVRWAARARGETMKANLVGTDLVPLLFGEARGTSRSYFLLGSDRETIRRAAEYARACFPRWRQAGFHHGYLDEPAENDRAIEAINRSGADVLLVGMGNPRQERWIAESRSRLATPMAIGVGGLFDHWAGNLARAPSWVRRAGFEWLQLLLQQPHKWRRYLIGNPLFVYRMLATRSREVGSRRLDVGT
ncbi:WecB/TagA/CpsF family glycosyltransferase [Rhodoplanes roseus]|uniref:Glycosyltransferase n=1 Tax=Rhodoplanes roseus TaxID=29409 RepID=A0A327L126_9BRAD|nr:WecB/TagA/CpsF family glycosyltransferase [Rhodoplanes roseus]RAI43655.1 hypothetical protein CH341_13115 [Rhodoplanes roseus]